MVKRGSVVLALVGVWLVRTSTAQEAEAPDLDFLEYLGSWQGDDDEWVAIAEWEKDNPPRGEEGEGEKKDEHGKGAKPETDGNDDDEGN